MTDKEIELAAYELLDDFHYNSDEFLLSSGWIFTSDEQYLIHLKMAEIENERASAPVVDIPL